METIMDNIYIMFRQDSSNPSLRQGLHPYLGTHQTMEECEIEMKKHDFPCVILVLNIDYETTKSAFGLVNAVMEMLDDAWTSLVAKGDII